MPRGVSVFGRWFALFLLLWLILSGGGGWVFGVAAALAAAALACRLPLAWPGLNLARLPACLGFFSQQLFIGGWDVARRALHPKMPIDPAWEVHAFSSDNPSVHLLLSALVGLMPGTLASHYAAGQLHIHTLDRHRNWRTNTERFEQLLDQLLRTAPEQGPDRQERGE